MGAAKHVWSERRFVSAAATYICLNTIPVNSYLKFIGTPALAHRFVQWSCASPLVPPPGTHQTGTGKPRNMIFGMPLAC